MEDYRVNLDVYNGPLDLLLYLIRRDELDIYDIPIARVTEQYVQYVQVLQQVDPNLAGEFLVMAATLMEIKTRLLLPPEAAQEGPEAGAGIDPRTELIRQLLQYKAFKDAAGDLAAAAQLQAMKFPRRPAVPGQDRIEYDLEDVQVWDLLDAFSKLMAAIGQQARPHEVIYDDTPVELHAADIMDRLGREGAMSFARIFEGRTVRGEIIGLFLALLELVRQRKVLVVQEGNFGQIQVIPNPRAMGEPADRVASFADPAGADAAPAGRAGRVVPAQGVADSDALYEPAEPGQPSAAPAETAAASRDADAGQYVSDYPQTPDEPGQSEAYGPEDGTDDDSGENQGIGA